MHSARFRPALLVIGIVVASVWNGAAQAQLTEASESTELCQKLAQKEAAKLAATTRGAIAACLQRIAQVVVKENQATIDVAAATPTCLAKFYKLGRTDQKSLRDKMAAKIRKFCDPSDANYVGAHVANAVLGGMGAGVNQPLSAAALDAYCSDLAAGSGTIAGWVGCLETAAECQARQQIAVEFPRALEWLELMDARFATSSSAKAADARSALRAVDDAIEGALDDDMPEIACGPTAGVRLPRSGQATSYGPGDDGDVQAGLSRSFTDNGNGTITDHATGLMWEKKEDRDFVFVICKTENSAASCEKPHDADNAYEWCEDLNDDSICDNPGTPYDGPVVTVFLEQLNNRCDNDISVDCTTNGDADCGVDGRCGFAGFRDWRLPNRLELETLRNHGNASNPGTFATFEIGCAPACTLTDVDLCSCTSTGFYFSSTTDALQPNFAYAIGFSAGGGIGVGEKAQPTYARAVRGGL